MRFEVHWRLDMATKIKKFDCVRMKNEIQAQRMAEYERMGDQVGSFADFVKARTEKSEWVREMLAKIRHHHAPHESQSVS